ncbi:unnamed protein product [Sympodiomycopsis kandeliae]
MSTMPVTDARHRTNAASQQVYAPTKKPSSSALATAAAEQQQLPPPKEKAKKKQHEKPINLPDPPQIIVDESGVEWDRGKLLGSGGFARVYDAVNALGEQRAFKVVAKKHLQSRKARSKILAEIMIHSSLDHPNVVRMEDTFEDDEHVYFKLELCKAGSMNDMVKRRGRYLDAEARFFMVQILAGCQGMHTNNIIHRDLKLGNIFLDERMNVKIGDFGLAALLKEVGERKKTVCGTPNYIAPEILYDEGEGHSFEVDVWSVGVILYTMLVGKPPFQTSDIEKIYEKIKDNDYRIPPEAKVRPEAQDLITRILAPRPSDRPSLCQIMEHPWFTCAAIPTFIPLHAIKEVPILNLPTTWPDNERNFEIVKQRSQWNPYAEDLLDEEEPELDPREELRQQEALEHEREKMDKQFHRAIQPASPISTLLKAGRQPLLKTTAGGGTAKANEGSLARQLQALSIGRAQSQQNIASVASSMNGKGSKEAPERVAPQPPVSSRAGSVVVDKENARPGGERLPTNGSAGNMGPPSALPSRRGFNNYGGAPSNEGGGDAEERRMLGQKARLVAGMAGAQGSAVAAPTSRPTTAASSDEEGFSPLPPSSKASMLDLMVHYLYEAVKSAECGLLYSPLDSENNKIRLDEAYSSSSSSSSSSTRAAAAPAPRRFIICWVDHSEKYGLGYALSDGTMGVHFRDATSISLNARRDFCDYVPVTRRSSRLARGTEPDVKRENFSLEGYSDSMDQRSSSQVNADDLPFPVELHPKVKVLRFFESELGERLYGSNSPLTFSDDAMSTGMTYVMKWWRCQSAMVFRLSNGVFQFNFYDHIKVFISHNGLVISFIPPVEVTGGVQQLRPYYISELVAIAHPERSAREADAAQRARETGTECRMKMTTPTERKLVRNIIKKLRNCREILESMNRGSQTSPYSTGNAPTSRTASTASVNSVASKTASTRR